MPLTGCAIAQSTPPSGLIGVEGTHIQSGGRRGQDPERSKKVLGQLLPASPTIPRQQCQPAPAAQHMPLTQAPLASASTSQQRGRVRRLPRAAWGRPGRRARHHRLRPAAWGRPGRQLRHRPPPARRLLHSRLLPLARRLSEPAPGRQQMAWPAARSRRGEGAGW